jgi:hypothetical protein
VFEIKEYLLLGTLSSAMGLIAAHIVTTRVLLHLKEKISLQLTLFYLILFWNFVAINVGIISLQNESHDTLLIVLFYFLITFNAFAYCYFHVFNLSDTARRIRILIMIKTGEITTIEHARYEYSPKIMVENRLNRLIDMKQITVDDAGNYRLSGKFLLTAFCIINLWKNFINLKD